MQKIVLDFVGGWRMLLQNQYLTNDQQRCEVVRQLYQRMCFDLLSVLHWASTKGIDFTLMYPNPMLDPIHGARAEIEINNTLQLLAVSCHTQLNNAELLTVPIASDITKMTEADFPFGLEHVTPSFVVLVKDSTIPPMLLGGL